MSGVEDNYFIGINMTLVYEFNILDNDVECRRAFDRNLICFIRAHDNRFVVTSWNKLALGNLRNLKSTTNITLLKTIMSVPML